MPFFEGCSNFAVSNSSFNRSDGDQHITIHQDGTTVTSHASSRRGRIGNRQRGCTDGRGDAMISPPSGALHDSSMGYTVHSHVSHSYSVKCNNTISTTTVNGVTEHVVNGIPMTSRFLYSNGDQREGIYFHEGPYTGLTSLARDDSEDQSSRTKLKKTRYVQDSLENGTEGSCDDSCSSVKDAQGADSDERVSSMVGSKEPSSPIQEYRNR